MRCGETIVGWVFDEEVLAVLAAIMIVSAAFAVSQAFYAGRVVEPFSELGLLGRAGKIGDYPKEVPAGSSFLLNLYVGNHEGRTMYYRILVKVGGKESVINASIPLDIDPILDVRVVLIHNSSKIIPLNLTLYEPAERARLVFEMWVFNETTGGFSYHNRWNQLWINVTKPPSTIGNQRPQKQNDTGTIDDLEIESKLIEAFQAVRKAEDSGGDVSEMVRLLNEAMKLYANGKVKDAENLLSLVLLLQAEVVEAGIEASRMRLYVITGALTVTSLACVSLYLYLRHNLWLLWARFHKECTVQWKGGSQRLEEGERRIVDAIRSRKDLTVADLVGDSKGHGLDLGLNPSMIAEALHRMARSGIVKIVDPNPPGTFSAYLPSRYNIGFLSAITVLGIGIVCVYASEFIESSALRASTMENSLMNTGSWLLLSGLFAVVTIMRHVLGAILVLFLPGYSLIEALYPAEEDLSPLERLALSIGLSLAIVPLAGLLLNYSPWGVRLDPTMAALAFLSFSLLLLSAYRKFKIMKLRMPTKEG